MNLRFRIPSMLPLRLGELGISEAAVLRHAGLPLGLFQQEKALLVTEDFFALWHAIAEVSGDPTIGLRIGGDERVERYDPVCIAALYTRTFRDALQRMGRYKQITCPEEIEITEQNDECLVHFKFLHAKDVEPPALLDVCFAWIMLMARRGTGRKITPVRVELRRPPVEREIYEEHFGCRVKFSATRNMLVFRRSDVDIPFLTYNPQMLKLIAPQLEEELQNRAATLTVGEQAKAIVKRLLAGQRPSIHDLAREMNISQRTLQRRLTSEGTTFQTVLETARRELAHHYLRYSSLELNETAYLLGYEDANSFYRAFHLWEGITPGRWRDRHRTPVGNVA
jgi:AraC-like DNA-binding protein